jgi:putative FmdB family regulatory protein
MQYEYECPIHQVFEVTQKMSDPPFEECPLCRAEKDIHTSVNKLISLSSFQLVGGGWARDSYSSK